MGRTPQEGTPVCSIHPVRYNMILYIGLLILVRVQASGGVVMFNNAISLPNT